MNSHLERLHKNAFDRCIPLNVTIEITLRCNLRCVHCYNFDRDLPYAPANSRQDELSDREILRILDEVRAEGCLFLGITGGEALLHPGLEGFIRHARAAGMSVRLKSNGSLLGPGTIERLVAAGATAIDISLYGSVAETHDGFVRAPGAFERSIAGALRARDAGLETRLSFVLVRQNTDQIASMIELAVGMGLRYSVDPQLRARYDGSRSSLDNRLDIAAFERLFRGPLRDLLPPPDPQKRSVQCSCARSVCGITAFGTVYPCIGAPLPTGDLRRESFPDVWHGSPVFRWIRGLTLEDFPACRGCDHIGYCPRSSGVVYTNTGMYNGPERFGGDGACLQAEVYHRIHDELAASSEEPPPPADTMVTCG